MVLQHSKSQGKSRDTRTHGRSPRPSRARSLVVERLEPRRILSLGLSPIVGLDPGVGSVDINGVAVDVAGDTYITGQLLFGSVNLNPAGKTVLTAAGYTEGFVAKYSASGQYLWNWYFYDTPSGIPTTGAGLAIALDAQGNPVVTGTLGSSLFVQKYNAQTGTAIWYERFGNAAAGDGIAVDGTGDIYITGSFTDSSLAFGGSAGTITRQGTQDMVVAKLDPSGRPLWAQDIGAAGDSDGGRGVAVDSAGEVFITGQVHNSTGFGVYYAKLSSSGSFVWGGNSGGGPSANMGSGIALDGQGNVYVVGTLAGTGSFGGAVGNVSVSDPSDLILLKMNSSGQAVGLRTIGDASHGTSGAGLAIDGANHIDVTGSAKSTSGSPTTGEALLAEYDSALDPPLSFQTYGSTGESDGGRAIATNAGGKVAVAGFFSGSLSLGIGVPALSALKTGAFVASTGLVAPVAQPQSYSVRAGQTLHVAAPGVLNGDTVPAGLTLSLVSHTTPAFGSLTLNRDGSFDYTPNAGLTGQESFNYTIGDGTFLTASASVTITVQPLQKPTINWARPAGIVYGTALGAGQLDATTNVLGTFTYSPPPGTVLHAGDGQVLSVTFTPSDTAEYAPVSATTTIDVRQALPTIAWPTPADIVYGTALGAAQLDATSDVPGTFTYSPPPGTVLSAGEGRTLAVTFTPADRTDYTSVTATTTLNVRPAPANGGQSSASSTGAPHVVGIVGTTRLGRRLTSITIAFDEALNAVSAQNDPYLLLRGVRRRKKVIYVKRVGIESAGYDGGAHTVTLRLARPTKGPIEVLVPLGGIVGAGGATRSGLFSSVVD